jgi:hypothetical protein
MAPSAGGYRAFSRGGLGIGLAGAFDSAVARYGPQMLSGPRGGQFLMTCDIGGSLKGQAYETYAFLMLDLDRNSRWLSGQSLFRRELLQQRRRMCFKAMNDVFRRRALPPFLGLAEELDGVLVTFVVDKVDRPNLAVEVDLAAELAPFWKRSVIDRLMWVTYLGAFLLSGFAAADQNVMFIIDEDEVAANVPQLTKLTELFGRAFANQEDMPMMGHLRCGTTKSDDGSQALEDLNAIPDLAAGALGELTDALRRQGLGPLSPLIQRLPPMLTWKTRTIMPWLMRRGRSLTRFTCMIDGGSTPSKWRATIPEWWVVDDPPLDT